MDQPGEITIRALTAADHDWVVETLVASWGSAEIVTRGVVHDAAALPGFVAVTGDQRVGLVTYRPDESDCEILSLNSFMEGCGIGTALLLAVEAEARQLGLGRVWLVTTNDNLHAVRFYQRRGYRLAALHTGAIDVVSRRIKPSIPLTGIDDIPIRDEIEIERMLETARAVDGGRPPGDA
ncbi:MAG: GNAT family N-acetyltransferase [Candidatus Eiseniibacteriota bacterium]|jgi:ribosomal protein S18 acetylase RimI-like enzyme